MCAQASASARPLVIVGTSVPFRLVLLDHHREGHLAGVEVKKQVMIISCRKTGHDVFFFRQIKENPLPKSGRGRKYLWDKRATMLCHHLFVAKSLMCLSFVDTILDESLFFTTFFLLLVIFFGINEYEFCFSNSRVLI